MQWRRAVAGLVVAVGVVGLFVSGVGWNEVLEHVRAAHPAALAAALVAGLGMLALRGALVKRLLAPIDGAAGGTTFATAYLSGYFARSALPWGRSTGTPVMAYLLARDSDSEFEDNLAVVAAAEGFNLVGSLVLAGIGVAIFATVGGGSIDTVIGSLAVAGGGGLLTAGALIVVFNRGVARRVSFGFAARCETAVGSLPRLPSIEGRLTGRIDGFFGTLEAIQASRRTLVVAFGIAVASWVLNALPLYFGLLALGVDVPLALVLVCAPLASFGGIVPLPGGSGGIEVVLASLLVATAGVPADVATAAAILYRLTTYWAHFAISGCVAVLVSVFGTKPALPIDRGL
ncbi:flippase-like domain-containing protein [Natronococcus sp. A-GB7]|uniref:lysylphosphatidylglycerol synthase transmembrane domain-containing protein n=1 Tax=Natronococcus sp. A-GB7 TaxID=3037649 RepID=UPI002420029C|nr:flippase-like domain-containing protein [Natronococcus sp. A-GB7]MDG5819218.1 flippase-like domain-containing protein [Natronococcus sp. A-GB7]